MTKLLAGLDIGGTKCAVSLGLLREDGVSPLARVSFPTPQTPDAALAQLSDTLARLLAEQGASGAGAGAAASAGQAGVAADGAGESAAGAARLAAIGISCGGPLDSTRGLVLSPPNLPGWDGIDAVGPFRSRFGVPVALQNDANACALAEWKWGAGAGSRHMVFLTFGTGMGAGLILNGRLYAGANDMAGEIGHMRMEPDGPVGYGKAGSFEGFCSGGGIAQLAATMAGKRLRELAVAGGEAASQAPAFCRTADELPHITAQKVGEAAQAGDALALEVFRVVGEQLGRGLAVLVDVLNPERIVIGSIYGRQQQLLEPVAMEALRRESLAIALDACRILPAGLGEQVGDYAALSVALLALEASEE
ncbi:MAG: ROK family protein [Paenibacillaceae bacterium]|nr:ROK family protein [Paenibacillaceae bacterium]